MTELDLSRAAWHKSSHSSQDGNCVEVASNLPGAVAVRDSKHADSPPLAFAPATWKTFTEQLKASA